MFLNDTGKLKINLEKLHIQLKPSFNWFPLTHLRRILIEIHSPNTFPNMKDDTMFISVQGQTEIKYTQITTELLESPYETNCFKYDLNYKFANFNMRSDCMTSCIHDYIHENCHDDTIIPLFTLLRVELLRNDKYIDKHLGFKDKNMSY